MDDLSPSRLLQLVAKARAGDTDAVGKLLQSFRQYLRLLAELQIDEQYQAKIDASDVVQETFLDAHRDFAQFHGSTESELMVWLRRILANNLADHVLRHFGRQRRDLQLERSLHQELEHSSHCLDQSFVLAQPSPSQIAVRREQAVVLADALEKLPEDYRQVLVLRHLKGLKFPEVARRMDRSVGGVQQLWTRAVAELRRSIVEE